MTANDLKECPFCGGMGEFWAGHGKYGEFVYVKCATCDAQTRIKTAKGNDNDDGFWEQAAVSAVASMWNRRV